MYSWGPQKHLQDRRTTFLKPLFWHAKHAQNAPAKFVPDTIERPLFGGKMFLARAKKHPAHPPHPPSQRAITTINPTYIGLRDDMACFQVYAATMYAVAVMD
jgi:hypothetical protein